MPLILSFLLFAGCSVAGAAEVQGKVTRHGVFEVSGREETVNSPETTTGVTGILADAPLLVASTNRIPAKIGVNFGLWCEIANVPVANHEVELTVVVTHPAITRPDGTIWKGFTTVEKASARNGQVVSWTLYRLEYAYELVTGEWEFEIQFKGETVCKQTFTTFKP
jgi:Domain of unknown function (DUF3859)